MRLLNVQEQVTERWILFNTVTKREAQLQIYATANTFQLNVLPASLRVYQSWA